MVFNRNAIDIMFRKMGEIKYPIPKMQDLSKTGVTIAAACKTVIQPPNLCKLSIYSIIQVPGKVPSENIVENWKESKS